MTLAASSPVNVRTLAATCADTLPAGTTRVSSASNCNRGRQNWRRETGRIWALREGRLGMFPAIPAPRDASRAATHQVASEFMAIRGALQERIRRNREPLLVGRSKHLPEYRTAR